MEKIRNARTWFLLLCSLLLAVVLVACDNDEEAGGGGLANQTPQAEVTDELGDEVGEPTEMVEATEEPTEAAEPTEAVEPTEEPTATAEPTEEPTATAEPATEGEAAAEPGLMVVQSSSLIGRAIEDMDGAEVAFVYEVLVDDSGDIQYVIVQALGAEDDEDDDAAEDDVAATEPTSVALTWDSIQVMTGTTGTEDDDGIFDDENRLRFVYSGDTAIEEQQSFDLLILDEQGLVLDDQATEEDEVEVPAEFTGLIQLSEFSDIDLDDANDEDLGEVEDALVNLQEGRVTYLIVDFGGFLGIGEQRVAVPWPEIEIDVSVQDGEEDESFTLDITEERLENAPTIDLDDWDTNVDADWDAEFREFWEMDADTEGDTNG